MRALVQRCLSAKVVIDGKIHGEIGPGMVIFFGVTHSDMPADADYVAEKCVTLRIYEDDQGKMNRSLLDIGGAALVISQFTLYGDTSAGRRPSFTEAARPETAIPLYERFLEQLRVRGLQVETGIFGADMKVHLINDGPATFLVESKGH